MDQMDLFIGTQVDDAMITSPPRATWEPDGQGDGELEGAGDMAYFGTQIDGPHSFSDEDGSDGDDKSGNLRSNNGVVNREDGEHGSNICAEDGTKLDDNVALDSTDDLSEAKNESEMIDEDESDRQITLDVTQTQVPIENSFARSSGAWATNKSSLQDSGDDAECNEERIPPEEPTERSAFVDTGDVITGFGSFLSPTIIRSNNAKSDASTHDSSATDYSKPIGFTSQSNRENLDVTSSNFDTARDDKIHHNEADFRLSITQTQNSAGVYDMVSNDDDSDKEDGSSSYIACSSADKNSSLASENNADYAALASGSEDLSTQPFVLRITQTQSQTLGRTSLGDGNEHGGGDSMDESDEDASEDYDKKDLVDDAQDGSSKYMANSSQSAIINYMAGGDKRNTEFKTISNIEQSQINLNITQSQMQSQLGPNLNITQSQSNIQDITQSQVVLNTSPSQIMTGSGSMLSAISSKAPNASGSPSVLNIYTLTNESAMIIDVSDGDEYSDDEIVSSSNDSDDDLRESNRSTDHSSAEKELMVYGETSMQDDSDPEVAPHGAASIALHNKSMTVTNNSASSLSTDSSGALTVAKEAIIISVQGRMPPPNVTTTPVQHKVVDSNIIILSSGSSKETMDHSEYTFGSLSIVNAGRSPNITSMDDSFIVDNDEGENTPIVDADSSVVNESNLAPNTTIPSSDVGKERSVSASSATSTSATLNNDGWITAGSSVYSKGVIRTGVVPQRRGIEVRNARYGENERHSESSSDAFTTTDYSSNLKNSRNSKPLNSKSSNTTANPLEWVQCDNCKKWRTVAEHIDLNCLPDTWYCSNNSWNPHLARCSAAQEEDIENTSTSATTCGNDDSMDVHKNIHNNEGADCDLSTDLMSYISKYNRSASKKSVDFKELRLGEGSSFRNSISVLSKEEMIDIITGLALEINALKRVSASATTTTAQSISESGHFDNGESNLGDSQSQNTKTAVSSLIGLSRSTDILNSSRKFSTFTPIKPGNNDLSSTDIHPSSTGSGSAVKRLRRFGGALRGRSPASSAVDIDIAGDSDDFDDWDVSNSKSSPRGGRNSNISNSNSNSVNQKNISRMLNKEGHFPPVHFDSQIVGDVPIPSSGSASSVSAKSNKLVAVDNLGNLESNANKNDEEEEFEWTPSSKSSTISKNTINKDTIAIKNIDMNRSKSNSINSIPQIVSESEETPKSGSLPIPSSNAHSVDKIESVLDAAIPVDLTSDGKIWKSLSKAGWGFANAPRGESHIYNYVYYRPGMKPTKDNKLNRDDLIHKVDYFKGEEELNAAVEEILNNRRKKQGPSKTVIKTKGPRDDSDIDESDGEASEEDYDEDIEEKDYFRKSKSKKSTNKTTSNAISKSSSSNSLNNKALPVTTRPSGESKIVAKKNNNSASGSSSIPSLSSSAALVAPVAPVAPPALPANHNWISPRIVNPMGQEWSELWKLLIEECHWNWDYGLQNREDPVDVWYLAPGYTKETAIAGQSKFSSMNSVRKFCQKLRESVLLATGHSKNNSYNSNNRVGNALARLNDSHTSNNTNDYMVSIEESQSFMYDSDAKERVLGSWTLAGSRSKRTTIPSEKALENDFRNEGRYDRSRANDSNDDSNGYESDQGKRSVSELSDNDSPMKESTKRKNTRAHEEGKRGGSVSSSVFSKKSRIESALAPMEVDESDFGTQPQAPMFNPDRGKYNGNNSSVFTPISKKSLAESANSGSASSTPSSFPVPRPVPRKPDPNMFNNYIFVFTGIQDDKLVNSLQEQIKKHGGGVMEAGGSLANRDQRKSYILLSKSTGFRRHSYLMALSCGLPIVHHQWLPDCVHSGSLKSLDNYCLPSGSSVLHPLSLFNPKRSPMTQQRSQVHTFFKDSRFLNSADKVWDEIICCCGGSIIPMQAIIDKKSPQEFLEQLAKIPRDKWKGPLYLLIDALNFCDTTTKSSMKKEAIIPTKVMELISAYQAYDHKNSINLQIVTTDWVTHCVALQRVADPQSSPLFGAPSDPESSPPVHKLPSDQGGEKYSSNDFVFFSTSKDKNSTNRIGKILQFKKRDALLNCVIQEFSQAADSRAIEPYSAKPIIIDSKCLRGKLQVVSTAAYKTINGYRHLEHNIFMASSDWESSLVDDDIDGQLLDDMFVSARTLSKSGVGSPRSLDDTTEHQSQDI